MNKKEKTDGNLINNFEYQSGVNCISPATHRVALPML